MANQVNSEGVLSGRTALVTGATRGIGKGIAQCMAEAGAHVIVSGRDPAVAAAVAEDLKSAGGRASALACDLSDEDAVGTLIPRALEQDGGLDILVNNAGIDDERLALGYPLEVWRKILQVNLEVPFRLAQAAAPHFLERGSGVVINISSVLGLVGSPTECAYASAKHGLNGLTKVLAIEWASKGIRVNAIAPGLIQTDMTKFMWEGGGAPGYIERRIPQGRIGQAREIGAAAVFLAADAASFIQGETLVVDGGFIAT